MTAILGTFVAMKTMADGTVRITLDLQCKLPEFAAMGTDPGTPFGIARITQEASQAQAREESIGEEKSPLGPLAKWAVMRCKESAFMEFIREKVHGQGGVSSEDGARRAICALCGVISRREIDTSPVAARLFRERVMQPWSVSPLNPHREAA